MVLRGSSVASDRRDGRLRLSVSRYLCATQWPRNMMPPYVSVPRNMRDPATSLPHRVLLP
ncbi:uncharacterized protein B0H18DRAFT_225996 [Fomitopsis serialis]|uniref:uncharacterized protein n=1 Tax=Fomitopsis serialis TaxID=139415 RepID=UPI002008675A|nr:uncharacterized protein B0H18DRAFT_225996 [Neoantrodia serialis]KAH9912887.1 hypothetical protein B0H18DRAFT_225996 [Neoantrodia serialis]